MHSWVIEANMVSTHRKKQSNRNLLSQLDDFDQDIIIGNTVSNMQENVTVNEGPGDQELTLVTSDNNLIFFESTMNVKTLKICFNETLDREMSNIVDTVEEKI